MLTARCAWLRPLSVPPLDARRCVPDIHAPRLARFPDPAPGLAAAGAGSGVHCMAVLPPSVSSSGALEVLVAVEETVKVLDVSEALPTSVFEGPILR